MDTKRAPWSIARISICPLLASDFGNTFPLFLGLTAFVFEPTEKAQSGSSEPEFPRQVEQLRAEVAKLRPTRERSRPSCALVQLVQPASCLMPSLSDLIPGVVGGALLATPNPHEFSTLRTAASNKLR